MKQKPQQPKNIIISHVYSSDNKGDAALTSVLIDDLKRTFPCAAITILKLEAVERHGKFESVPEKPGFMYYVANRYHNPLFKLSYALYMVSATLLWAAWLRASGYRLYLPAHLRDVAETYQQADLIVPVGGGYIRSRKGLAMRCNVPLLLHPLLFGYLLGKPTVLYSQSVGPFQNRLDKLLAAYVLKHMTLILLREDTSQMLLAHLGVADNVVRAIDSGFLLTSKNKLDIRKKYHIPANKLIMGVTVRSWLVGDAQIAYERAVAGALDDIAENFDAYILFIPQVTAAKGDDDRVVSRRVHGLMRHTEAATTIEDEPDHHHIKTLYDGLDVLLGTRFHSVIFSLTSLVPVLAIEYEHKTSGIMHDLGLEQWVMKIEDVTAPKLSTALHSLLRQSDNYKAHLRKQLPPYMRQARQTVELLEKAYYSAAENA
jgi:colanic acid/amylovoran biosynthesis protein